MKTIYYNNIPHPTHFNSVNGNVYKTDIRYYEKGKCCKIITVLRRFCANDTNANGWRMIDNGIEIEMPLWIKNKIELK